MGSFSSHKNQTSESAVRRDLRFFVLIREDLESLTVCRCHYTKAALSFQLFKDPGRGLNPRPPAQKTGALPTELTSRRLKRLDRVDQAGQAEISICIQTSWPGQEGDLTIEKGQVTLLVQPTFCFLCNVRFATFCKENFLTKCVPHPSSRANVNGSPCFIRKCVSGKQVTLLSSTTFLHTNGGFCIPGASLRGRRRKTVTGRFAYKSFRLHSGRFAYKIKVVSPTE